MTITVVGIGYGADVTAATATALGEADVVIGHEVFLDAVKEFIRPEAERFDVLDQATASDDVFAVRTRAAVQRSAAGANVVIVSGGDPGLLGMAGPVLRNVPRAELAGVRVLPGLSAWQYASAILGAPFNEGVAVISLCLYTHSVEKIQRQIAGVASSGLGAVVYMIRHNGEQHPSLFPTSEPAVSISRRRLVFLRDAFLRHRPGDTPVFLITGIGNPSGHVIDSAPLERAVELWERSGPESVLCVPGSDFSQAGDRVWVSA